MCSLVLGWLCLLGEDIKYLIFFFKIFLVFFPSFLQLTYISFISEKKMKF